jgi:hypothetical protein
MTPKFITLDFDTVGYIIHAKGDELIRSATEPTIVTMKFHGGNIIKKYSHQCASEGDAVLAREYLQHLLDTHDRYYDFSDDHRAWEKGRTEWSLIQTAMNTMDKRGIEYKDIFNPWNEKGKLT